MKTLLILLLICNSVCFGQKKCDSGYSYMPTIATTSLKIEADTCLPDSVCRKLWREFRKNMCGETATSYIELGGNGSLWYSRNHIWDEVKGCIGTEEYKVMRGNKWVTITKEQYTKLVKKRK